MSPPCVDQQVDQRLNQRTSRHESRILLLALLGPLPALVVAYVLGQMQEPSAALGWSLATAGAAAWIGAALAVRGRVTATLENVASLIASLRQGDFSVRGRGSGGQNSLSATLTEINGLADTLARQQASALEASALLAKVMAEIDVAVFAFDRQHRLKLVNRAGERLLASPALPALGTSARDLGLAQLLEGPAPRTVHLSNNNGAGRNETERNQTGPWELRRSAFRSQGLPHELVVLSDLRRALRAEERQAWQRIIRVMGHEINNSLAPIRSLACDLQSILDTQTSERPSDLEEDLKRGLAVIDRRAAGLDRFMTSYARLAKLPPPRFGTVEVEPWVRRIVELERRMPVRLTCGPSLVIPGDADQLDQLLINLVRNGVDSALTTGGKVEVTWQRRGSRQVELTVVDEGLGVSDTDNLFVPFFTTKPEGSGIGLALSRQICEAHNGSLTLSTRSDGPGAIARLRLPL